MDIQPKLHAKKRPPSAAARWIPCPASTLTSQLHFRDETDASTKGDYAHDKLETCILFGIRAPQTEDETLNENLTLVMDWIYQTRALYGSECKVYAEQQFEIVETGEFGTGDVTFVSPQVLHIADYKNGYVVVDVARNAQMLTYLLGAISKYGVRDSYYITVLQPNYDHIDGPIRTVQVTHAEVEAHRVAIAWSMANEHVFAAGPHCKKTYCDHRGNCKTFLAWAETNAADAWFPHDVNALTDEQLAKALDHAEVLQGIRDELRKAAMTRMMQSNRQIPGYKMVKGRRTRELKDAKAVEHVLREQFNATDKELFTQDFISVLAIENLVKAWARKHGFQQGKWKAAWDNHIADYVREHTGGLSLERATDGRPTYRRGGEFGLLTPDGTNGTNGKVSVL